jgi:hypothetical protein
MQHNKYFILKSFGGALGQFDEGTERGFGESTALLLRDSGLVTPVGSAAHKAYLAAADGAAPSDTPDETADAPAPVLETKPAPLPELETKPEPAKAPRKAPR